MFEVVLVDEGDVKKLVRLLDEGLLWTLDELPPSEHLV